MFASMLVALALTAQERVLRVPRVPATPRPVVIAPLEQQPGQLGVDLKPDLVVRELRVGADNSLRVLIANEGTAATVSAVRVSASALAGTRNASAPLGALNEPLGIGEAKWFPVSGFVPRSEAYYAGKDYSFPFADITGFSVTLDPPVVSTAIGRGVTRELQMIFGAAAGAPAKPCTAEYGCIAELNEANNYATAKRADMQPHAD